MCLLAAGLPHGDRPNATLPFSKCLPTPKLPSPKPLSTSGFVFPKIMTWRMWTTYMEPCGKNSQQRGRSLVGDFNSTFLLKVPRRLESIAIRPVGYLKVHEILDLRKMFGWLEAMDSLITAFRLTILGKFWPRGPGIFGQRIEAIFIQRRLPAATSGTSTVWICRRT